MTDACVVCGKQVKASNGVIVLRGKKIRPLHFDCAKPTGQGVKR